MVQVVAAIFKGGVFKPDQPQALHECEHVHLVVETVGNDEAGRREESWAALHRVWETSRLNSGGDRMTRDQLHERR